MNALKDFIVLNSKKLSLSLGNLNHWAVFYIHAGIDISIDSLENSNLYVIVYIIAITSTHIHTTNQ